MSLEKIPKSEMDGNPRKVTKTQLRFNSYQKMKSTQKTLIENENQFLKTLCPSNQIIMNQFGKLVQSVKNKRSWQNLFPEKQPQILIQPVKQKIQNTIKSPNKFRRSMSIVPNLALSQLCRVEGEQIFSERQFSNRLAANSIYLPHFKPFFK